jgi:uncharacterized protein (TIGR02996 family)
LREALEAALVENPDDLAAHRAYADHLMELGDPRGEFIQVQLALEDADAVWEANMERASTEGKFNRTSGGVPSPLSLRPWTAKRLAQPSASRQGGRSCGTIR